MHKTRSERVIYYSMYVSFISCLPRDYRYYAIEMSIIKICKVGDQRKWMFAYIMSFIGQSYIVKAYFAVKLNIFLKYLDKNSLSLKSSKYDLSSNTSH